MLLEELQEYEIPRFQFSVRNNPQLFLTLTTCTVAPEGWIMLGLRGFAGRPIAQAL